MSQWKFGGTIPRIEKDPKERILTALCVLAGADQAYFISDSPVDEGINIHHPLREKMGHRFNFFSPKIRLPGMTGEIRFLSDKKGGFDERHKRVTRLLIKILEDQYEGKKEIADLSPALQERALTWFYNHMHAEISDWHHESAVHSEQVALLYNHFRKHSLRQEDSPFKSYFQGQEKLSRYNYMRAALHDVGKFMIPHEVLNFEGDFRDEMPTKERYKDQMNLHAPLGYYILGAFGEDAATLAGYHHQFHTYVGEKKWKEMHKVDSRLRQAYPFFSTPVTIPLESQILQVLDTAEGICHKRGYKGKSDKDAPGVNKRPLRNVAEMLPILVAEAKAGVLNPLVVREVLEHRLYEPLLNFPSTTLTHNPEIVANPSTNQNPWDSLTDEQRLYILKEEPVRVRKGSETVEVNGIEGVREAMLSELALATSAQESKGRSNTRKPWTETVRAEPPKGPKTRT